MADHDGHAGPLLLSADETRVLELHDRLQQLQLEIALLNAQNRHVPDDDARDEAMNGDRSEADRIERAQAGLLEARARYILRNEVVDSVLSANPLLQAAHSGQDASPVERDILPHILSLDAAASAHATRASAARADLRDADDARARAARLERENALLAAEVVELARQGDDDDDKKKRQGLEDEDPEMALLETQARDARRRWRVAKAAAAAVVAGSGVDWAGDPALRRIVLDGEDEGV